MSGRPSEDSVSEGFAWCRPPSWCKPFTLADCGGQAGELPAGSSIARLMPMKEEASARVRRSDPM